MKEENQVDKLVEEAMNKIGAIGFDMLHYRMNYDAVQEIVRTTVIFAISATRTESENEIKRLRGLLRELPRSLGITERDISPKQ